MEGEEIMKCKYCNKESINESMWHIREAIKPHGLPRRWRVIGYCCDKCEKDGYDTTIDKYTRRC